MPSSPIDMRRRRASFPAASLSLALSALAAGAAGAETVSDSIEVAGTRVELRAVLPRGYDPAGEYPAVLAFPGGGQTLGGVERMLEDNWRAEAERRGYLVFSPAAPELGLFFQGGDAVFPALLDALLERYPVEGGRFHVAGVSNGGASAFHVAAAYPDYFLSVTGLPGYLPYATAEKFEILADLCVYMHVGERDRDWAETMAWQAQQLVDADGAARLWIEKGQGHIMRTLAGAGAARLFEHLEDAESGCGR